MLRGGEKSQPDMRKQGEKLQLQPRGTTFKTRRCFTRLLPRDTSCNRRSRERREGRESEQWRLSSQSQTFSLSFSLLVFPIWWSSGVRQQRCPFAVVSTYYLPVSLSPLTFFACANEIIRNIAMHLSFCSRPLCGLIHPLFAFFDRLFVPNWWFLSFLFSVARPKNVSITLISGQLHFWCKILHKTGWNGY